MTPNLNPNSDAKILQIFLQPIFATPEYENFQRPYPQMFWKPFMTPNLNLNSNAKFLQIFGIPILQTQNMKTSRGPTPKCYTFLETSHNPQLESQLRCQNFAIFLATHLLTSPSDVTDRSDSKV